MKEKTRELTDEELENVNGGRAKILFGDVHDGECEIKVTISNGYCMASAICEKTGCKYHN